MFIRLFKTRHSLDVEVTESSTNNEHHPPGLELINTVYLETVRVLGPPSHLSKFHLK